jgi:hypothetical protein
MANKIKNIVIGFVLIKSIFLTACFDNSDCANNFSDIMHIRFQKVQEDQSVVPTALELVQVRALEATQVLFDNLTATATATMFFRVNPFSDTTTYLFERIDKMDSLVVVFNRRPILINPECGMTQIININSVFTTFDSATVANPGLRYSRDQNIINLEIYH